MPRHSPQPDLDLPSGERLGELIGPVKQGPVGRNGQTLPGTAAVAPHQPRIAIPARPAELQRLLGASIDENRHLTAHVRRLEAELRRSSAELAKLRGELRGAVHDALTDPLTGLANRRSFDLELGAVGAAREQVVARAPRDGRCRSLQAGQRRPWARHRRPGVAHRGRGPPRQCQARQPGRPGWRRRVRPPAARRHSALYGRDRHPPVRDPRVPPARRARVARSHRADHALDRGGRWARGRKQLPDGMHAPTPPCTRRSAAAATGSASLACSSLSLPSQADVNSKFRPHMSL